MASNREPFSVGDIQCIAINDGTFSYPTDWFFSNVPQEQLEGSLRDHDLPLNQVVSPYTCLVVKTGKHTVLIDTGADGLAPTTGELLKNLKAEGITPEEITTVVLTHAHPDHIGGVLDTNSKPAFPNARYVMSRTEWNFWNCDPDLCNTGLDDHMKELLVTCARKNLSPLKGCLELLTAKRKLCLECMPLLRRGTLRDTSHWWSRRPTRNCCTWPIPCCIQCISNNLHGATFST